MLYDLCLTLTEAVSENAIASVALRCDALGLEPLQPQPLHDPFTADERKELEWYLETYWQWPYEQFAVRGQRVEQSLDVIGRRLYGAVFAAPQAREIVTAWRLLSDAERRLSIIGNVPRALSLPWELLHDEQGFLTLRTKSPVSIIRRLPQSALAALPTEFAPPLRVLLVTARPEEAGFVDPRGIARELFTAIQDSVAKGIIALEFLRPPTRAKLRERLSQAPPVHILHFDGHGTFGESQPSADGYRLSGGAQGMLAFEHDDGTLDLAPAEELAQLMQDSGVRLAVLTACQSAKGTQDDLFSSVAALMIRSGIDAVAAMSASVLVVSAAKYVAAFYRRLAAGESVTLAHERARQALHDDPIRHRHQRRRDEASQPIKLKDWWLPHFYLQRPLSFVVPPSGGMDLAAEFIPPEGGTTNLPPAPRYGFTGRARELQQIERWLLRGSAVTIHGFGGTGKTALACETADWLTRTGMYSAICFVSFEHGGDASLLLNELGNRLGVNTGEYDTRDVAKALAQLRPALRQRATLIIADNLESILPGGEAQLDAAARTQLWGVLLQLREMGAGVMLTSRDHEFGDGRMAQGRAVKHLPLRGLHPEDALALAERLFEDLHIPKARAPYPKLRDLLAQLDHHPLAIQLVLPTLTEDGMTIDRIAAEFAELLPLFVDDQTAGRNRSLMASLKYSLKRLGKWHQQLVGRLAPFEGGANESSLLIITEIIDEDWIRLRPALERIALLTPEWIENVEAPFLHFHPTLTPYLRIQVDAALDYLRSVFTNHYFTIAGSLYYEDTRNPQPVRAFVKRELPNLRRAFRWSLDDKDIDRALEMEVFLTYFLNFFGHWHERDELREWIHQAVAANSNAHLTRAEYLHQSGVAEDERASGNLRLAQNRFQILCQQLESNPEGNPLGRGSYEHCTTLHRLARCLHLNGQPDLAEKHLQQALVILEALLAAEPENLAYIRQRSALLTELGDAYTSQGNYQTAKDAYTAGLKMDEQQGDIRGQGVTQGQLGKLALLQRDYDSARQYCLEALRCFQQLNEPLEAAVSWHHLGVIANSQQNWVEAERCYRHSLEINEQHRNVAGVAATCNQLAIVAKNLGRRADAEGWYKRALGLSDLPPVTEAAICNNLAELLKNQVQSEGMTREKLAEANQYAERALRLIETPNTQAEIWKTEMILADIADLEGDAETSLRFRRRERESFAAYAGNRWYIDQHFSEFIEACTAAARGSADACAIVEALLPQLEGNGWCITSAMQQVWMGERDWHKLSENLNWHSALLVKRVLETLEQTV